MSAMLEKKYNEVRKNNFEYKYQKKAYRGELWMINLKDEDSKGSEQSGDLRPALVISNNKGNKYSPNVIVALVTSQVQKAKLPTHVVLEAEKYGLLKDSVVMLEHIRTISKDARLEFKITTLDEEAMKKVMFAYIMSCADDNEINDYYANKYNNQ